MAGIIGVNEYPLLWKVRQASSSPIATPIKVNSVGGPFAYLYIISYNWGDGDATYYECGIVRIGYSKNNVSKNIISERSRADISFSFSYNADGYVTVVSTSTSTYPSINVRLFG